MISMKVFMTCNIKPLKPILAQIVTRHQQGPLTLSFRVVKPLCNFLTEIVQMQVLKGKYENHFKTVYFTRKMKIISDVIILPFSWQMLGILGLFQSRRKHDLTNIMVHKCVFQKKKKTICYTFGKNARNKCFRSNRGSFQQISDKYLPFSRQALV